MKTEIEEARSEVAAWFIGLSGVFGHYSFFTKEEWRKVKGFENEDKAEVIAAFLHYWVGNKFGIYANPCGCGWFAELGKNSHDDYLEKYKPLFEAYKNWCEKQR